MSSQKMFPMHDSADAGAGVAVDDVAHGVCDQQPRHKQHQRADDDHSHAVEPAQPGRDICRQGHEKRRRDGAEKLVDLEPVEPARDKADDQAAHLRIVAAQSRRRLQHEAGMGELGQQRFPEIRRAHSTSSGSMRCRWTGTAIWT